MRAEPGGDALTLPVRAWVLGVGVGGWWLYVGWGLGGMWCGGVWIGGGDGLLYCWLPLFGWGLGRTNVLSIANAYKQVGHADGDAAEATGGVAHGAFTRLFPHSIPNLYSNECVRDPPNNDVYIYR